MNKAPSKTARILAYLIADASLNRFEAESPSDHCLNSTISELANRHRVIIKRVAKRVPTRWSKPCAMTRYTLLESEFAQAFQVLAHLGF
ncbi:hypothetical protein IB275_20600 [Pseudomonas sp. PDM21]|uniref:hypothetical protein n=1 Tax=Pseudomonas sp. PDM21 TaxID=2769257 RepID=UPI0017854EC2|nr:hypothetical protein [Pseudomonas sp. PDM21]MBD9672992.1 hypothetical protein [Pseudomonas sp. PDM21]